MPGQPSDSTGKFVVQDLHFYTTNCPRACVGQATFCDEACSPEHLSERISDKLSAAFRAFSATVQSSLDGELVHLDTRVLVWLLADAPIYFPIWPRRLACRSSKFERACTVSVPKPNTGVSSRYGRLQTKSPVGSLFGGKFLSWSSRPWGRSRVGFANLSKARDAAPFLQVSSRKNGG